jgi:hypothetical protein
MEVVRQQFHSWVKKKPAGSRQHLGGNDDDITLFTSFVSSQAGHQPALVVPLEVRYLIPVGRRSFQLSGRQFRLRSL